MMKARQKVGFNDPTELGFERTFKKPYPGTSYKNFVVPQELFSFYLDELRMAMRKALEGSEKARDTYYVLKKAYEDEKGLTGFELGEALKRDPKAQDAIANNIMYDRWATKYAAVLQAEIAYAEFMGWGKS